MVHGSRSSRAPRSVRLRTIELLMPVSSAAMRGPSPEPASIGSGGVTSAARSRPDIGGSPAIKVRASRSVTSPGKTPPSIAPRSRMCRTSARVSMPPTAAMPSPRSQSSHPASAPTGRTLTGSRMITERVCTRSDSVCAAATP